MHIFPQLRKLERKYAAELMVIGVHSAKFPNEKEKENLYKAVKRCELEHPVVNDGEFQVWQQYACRAWPTMMFIDPEGKVIGKQEGELPYEEMDRLIGEMVAEFDATGLIDRRPVDYAQDRLLPCPSLERCLPTRPAVACSSPTPTTTVSWFLRWKAW